VYEGLQLAVLLACVGAANSLASPYRLLRSMPAVLYEAGVVVTVALSFAPQASATAQSVRDARRLRGRPHRGLRGLRGMAVPVLEGALERSLSLASSMDSRGYGRKGVVAPGRQRATQVALAVGLLAAAAGIYGVLDAGSPSGLGLPALASGAALLAVSLMLGGGRSARTRYRPDPWRIPEWTTVVAGTIALAGVAIAASIGVSNLDPPISPVEVPLLPLLPALCVLVAAVPAFATPEPP
jgi:energy-coupling factor transport system permease protein